MSTIQDLASRYLKLGWSINEATVDDVQAECSRIVASLERRAWAALGEDVCSTSELMEQDRYDGWPDPKRTAIIDAKMIELLAVADDEPLPEFTVRPCCPEKTCGMTVLFLYDQGNGLWSYRRASNLDEYFGPASLDDLRELLNDTWYITGASV